MLGSLIPETGLTQYSWLWLIVAFIIVVLAWWLFKPPPPMKPTVTKVKSNQPSQGSYDNQSNKSCKLSPVPVPPHTEPIYQDDSEQINPQPSQPDLADYTGTSEDTFIQPDLESTTQAGSTTDLTNVYACRPYNGSSGRAEQICRNYLERRFGVIFPTCRPLFLRNPETKQPLELDCYNEELLLAVEYQGPQHYYWPNYLGGRQTITEFVALLRRDKFKVAMCNHLGVHMIRVPYWVKNKDIPGYIEERLPERLKLMPRAFS